jgi:hypothetical protein
MLQILADGGEHLRESLLAQLQRMVTDGGSAQLASLREALVKVLAADSHHRVDDEEHSGSWTRSWQVSALVIVAGERRGGAAPDRPLFRSGAGAESVDPLLDAGDRERVTRSTRPGSASGRTRWRPTTRAST